MVLSNTSKKKSASDMTRFVDYFFICGLSETTEPKLYKINEEGSTFGFQEKRLISSVLCHFPDNLPENPWNSAEMWKLCTPSGLSVFVGESPPTTVPHFHSFVITRENGFKCFGHVLAFYERCVKPQQMHQLACLLGLSHRPEGESIYVEKCIGFISQLALINTCEKVLQTLYKMFMEEPSQANNNVLPIESYIYNLLHEVPDLSPGGSVKLACMGFEEPTIIHQPTTSELPLLDVYLTQVMELVGGAKNLLNLLTSLLFEHQILLVSEDSHRLALVSEGITSLLFPFQWQYAQISVLPYELATRFFDAPVSYLIGVLVLPGQKELIRQALEVNQCYVDLDEAIVECPEDQPNFPNHKELIHQFKSFEDSYLKEMKILSKGGSISSEVEFDHFYPSHVTETKPNSSLRTNDAINRVADIAKKAGVINSLDDIESLHADVASDKKIGLKLQVSAKVFCEQKFNIKIRETLASVFVSIFLQYDKFVIAPMLDENGMWTFSTDTQDNFDKTSFLSDQPTVRLPFLLSFLDTQMFATLIDNSIICQQERGNTKDPNLRLFDDRIEQTKVPLDSRGPTSPDIHPGIHPAYRSISVSSYSISSPVFETWIKEAEQQTEKRLCKVDILSSLPHPITSQNDVENIPTAPGTFPTIRGSLLESGGFETTKKQLRRRGGSSRAAFKRQASFHDSKWRKIQEARTNLIRQPSISEYSPEIIAQTNWTFVEKLLKDIKQKTKKILVGKMGKEAVELGHGELRDSLSNLEESTWIASLCDLLERVWSHGLLTNHKKGKSALWSHLLLFQNEEEEKARKLKMMPHFGGSTPSLLENEEAERPRSYDVFDPPSSYYSLPRSFPRKRTSPRKMEGRHSSSDSTSNLCSIPQMSFTLLKSIEKIQSMREIQTEVGRSRAWIRLALEQKHLGPYLKQLLSDHRLLDFMYKKYSFLQCGEQQEQFLNYVLTLEAADFTCFTNSFTKTNMDYKVWIVPGRHQLGRSSKTSANVYMYICGELAKTDKIQVPKDCLEFSFEHKNLGMMTTLTLGHDDAGIWPKWLVDFVVVQNQITGQNDGPIINITDCHLWLVENSLLTTCRETSFTITVDEAQTQCYPCRRWFGRGVDDNSIERLLVPEIVPFTYDVMKFALRLIQQGAKPQTIPTIHQLQEKVGHAVNSLVKYYYKTEREKRLDVSPPPAAFTKLLHNLTMALECIFTHGLKSTGFFKRRLFALDIIEVCFESFRDSSPPTLLNPQQPPPSPPGSSDNHIAVGGDWFLGSRRTSAIGSSAQPRNVFFSTSCDEPSHMAFPESDQAKSRSRAAFDRMCRLYQQISNFQQRLGKDDVFHLLMLIGVHERLLSLWLPRISEIARASPHMYEEYAFLNDRSAVLFLAQIISLLVDNDVPLDNSLLRGCDEVIK